MPGHVDIILINKPCFQNVLRKDKYLRNFIKKHYGTIEHFYDYYKKSNGSLTDWFKNDDIALGVALGYGYSNSVFLSRRNGLSNYVHKTYGLTHRTLNITIPRPCTASCCGKKQIMMLSIVAPIRPATGWTSAQDELDWLGSIERKISQPSPPYLFSVPFFVARQGQETEELLQKYQKGTERLARLFQKGNAAQAIKGFVEKTDHQKS